MERRPVLGDVPFWVGPGLGLLLLLLLLWAEREVGRKKNVHSYFRGRWRCLSRGVWRRMSSTRGQGLDEGELNSLGGGGGRLSLAMRVLRYWMSVSESGAEQSTSLISMCLRQCARSWRSSSARRSCVS